MLRKFFNTEVKSIDKEARTVEVVFSTEDVDRDGEVVVQNGWDFEEYSQNPVILWSHDPHRPPVGKALDLRVEGKKSIAKIKMATNEDGENLWTLIAEGILRTVSAGFINTERDGERLLENKLLEISWVSIPANQNAITLAYESDMISKEQLKWLEQSTAKQLDYMRGKINTDAESKEKGGEMDEAKLQEMLAEVVKPIADQIAALEERISEQPKPEPKEPTPKPEEPKVEDDTKPADAGSTDSEEAAGEQPTEEEIRTAIAEGVNEVLAEQSDSNDED